MPRTRRIRNAADHLGPLGDVVKSQSGAYRYVAILFLETRSSSPRRLQPFFRTLTKALAETDGLLLKTDISPTGLKWLCVFGVPSVQERDAERAGHVALEVLSHGPSNLPVRAGLHAGIVANVVLGWRGRSSFDVMGDAVNTAARTLEHASWGEALVTESCRLGGFRTASRGRVSMRGRTRSEEVAAIQGLGGPRPLRVSAPMIGRRREIATIRSAWVEAKGGRGRIVSVGGDAGIGKSRLKRELSLIVREDGADFAEGRAISVGGTSYWAVRDLYRDLLGVTADGAAERALAAVTAESKRLGLSALDRHYLAEILGARYRDSPLAALEEKAVAVNARITLSRHLRRRADRRPLVVVLEDLHWADQSTREFISWLAPEVETARLLLVLLHRPGYQPPAGGIAIDLAPLSVEGITDLLRAHLGDGVSPELTDRILEQAEGNPFYVEELVRSFKDAGILAEGDGHRLVRSPEPDDVPPTLHRLIASRLDALPTPVRRVAEVASVLGRTFDLELLSTIPGMAPGLETALDELVSRELVFPNRAASRFGYIFKHALTRDVAYAEILSSRRRRLHRQAADGIEARVGRAGYEAMLGHHREEAGQKVQARVAYLAGARASGMLYAHQEAERLYRRCLELTADPDRTSVEARIELGRSVLDTEDRLEDAALELQMALAEAQRIGDRHLEARARSSLGWTLKRSGMIEEAQSLMEEALAIQRQRGVGADIAAELSPLAALHHERGNVSTARELLQESLALHREAGNRRQEAADLGRLATILKESGEIEEARVQFERALAMQREDGDRMAEGITLGHLAVMVYEQGRFDAARELYEQALEIHRHVGSRRQEGLVLGLLANLDTHQGRSAEARRGYAEALAICREAREPSLEGFWLGNLAILLSGEGETQAARGHWERAIELSRRVGHRRSEGIHLGNLASLDFSEGRLERARLGLERSLEVHREVGDRRSEAIAFRSLAQYELIATGDLDRAGSLLAAGRPVLAELDEFELAMLHVVEGHVAVAAGRSPTSSLESARQIASALNLQTDSVLHRTISKLDRASSAMEAGGPLVCGHCPEDLPDEQREWLRENRPDALEE